MAILRPCGSSSKIGRSLRVTALCTALLAPAGSAAPVPALDAFGILQLQPMRKGTQEWNSAHWGNGVARLVKYSGDPYDPTGWTDNHSSSSGDSLYIDGKGYARRLTAGGSAWDGMEFQVRTGPLAHASPGGNVCDATGYASRFRDDGNWDWEKELKHPNTNVYSTRAGGSAPLFPGKTIPLGKWIGMKFLAYNVDGGTHVRLETYIDTVSDVGSGPPSGGGHWEKVGDMVDDGTNFPGGDVSGCPGLTQSMAITEGHGTMLIRMDNEACEWKFVSFREIDPPVTSGLLLPGTPSLRASPGSPEPGRLWGGRFDAAGRFRMGKPGFLPGP